MLLLWDLRGEALPPPINVNSSPDPGNQLSFENDSSAISWLGDLRQVRYLLGRSRSLLILNSSVPQTIVRSSITRKSCDTQTTGLEPQSFCSRLGLENWHF